MEGAKLSCLATSPDQKLLVAGTPIGIAIFSLPELAPVRDVAGHPSAVTHVAFTPNGTIIAASEGGARVYESPSYARAPR
jgi:WD40 repeat protein